ncbi:MAG TPA: hypothetical protein VF132_10215 [Rudaea sp.]
MLRTRLSKRFSILATALLFGATCAHAQSEVETARVTIRAHQATQPSPWMLRVSGIWSTQCPPTLERVALDGADLSIEARSVLSLCPHRPTAFSIDVNSALATNRAALAPGIYHVGFYAATGNQGLPRLRSFALIDNGAPASSVVPESGFWWSSGDLKTGAHRVAVSMELQGAQLSVALLSYDDSGSPVWQFGTAALTGRIAHVPLIRTTGGSDPFAAAVLAPRGEAALTLDLQFHSGAHASAWLSRRGGTPDDPSLDLTTIDLVRLTSGSGIDPAVWQGDWILTADASFIPIERLHFGKARKLDATHFELEDVEMSTRLVCEHDDTAAEQLPRECVLSLTTDDKEIARFGALGISRMEGVRPDGFELHLIRVSH